MTTAAAAAVVLVDTWERLLASTPAWWVRRERGAVAGVTHVPLPTLNGVWVADPHPDTDLISALLDRVAADGVPHCLEVRPGSAAGLEGVAAARGMRPDESIPLMVRDEPPAAEGDSGELEIRALRPDQAEEHTALAAEGFGAPEAYFSRLVTPQLLRLPGVCAYVGEVDGEAVTTGLGARCGDSVGIFNVATPASQRGRGYGSAVTMHAVRDGFRAGARVAWLQSSPMGLPIYEKLGFRTVEAWRCWIASG